MANKKVVYEEDIEDAFRKSIDLFGPVGRMIYPIDKLSGFPNAVIYTKEHGKLWYGDIDAGEADKISNLSDILGVPVLLETT